MGIFTIGQVNEINDIEAKAAINELDGLHVDGDYARAWGDVTG